MNGITAMKKRIVIGIVLVVLVAAVILAMSKRQRRDDGTIRFSGNIEVTDVDLSFRVPGRVIARPVDEGMQLHTGTLVAALDPSTFQHEVDLRVAALDNARAVLAEL